ncbi:MAG TPA: hypothetical protein VIK45_09275 [Candidatus Dormibacteraeota bacterium]
MIKVGKAAGLIAVRGNQVDDLYGNGGFVGDRRPALNSLVRRSPTRQTAPLRDQMPGEQSQLLALDLN